MGWRGQAHPHAGGGPARRLADGGHLCAHGGQDRAGQCAVRSGPVQDRGDLVHLAHGHPRAQGCRGGDARDHAPPRHRLHRPGAQCARGRAGHRIAGRRAQPGDVGQRHAQHRQPAHDAGAFVRRAGAGGGHGAGGARGGQRVAVVRVRLPDGGRGRARRRVRLGAALRRPGRGRRHAVRHHGHGLPHAGGGHHRGGARALAGCGVHFALSQHARHGPGQCAGGHQRRGRPLRRLTGRPGRLPLRARRQRQRVQRGDRARARLHGLRHRRGFAAPAGRRAAPARADRPRHPQPDRQGRAAPGAAPGAGGLRGDQGAGPGAGERAAGGGRAA